MNGGGDDLNAYGNVSFPLSLLVMTKGDSPLRRWGIFYRVASLHQQGAPNQPNCAAGGHDYDPVM